MSRFDANANDADVSLGAFEIDRLADYNDQSERASLGNFSPVRTLNCAST